MKRNDLREKIISVSVFTPKGKETTIMVLGYGDKVLYDGLLSDLPYYLYKDMDERDKEYVDSFNL